MDEVANGQGSVLAVYAEDLPWQPGAAPHGDCRIRTYALCGCLAGCMLGLPLHRFFFNSMITSRWGLTWQPPYLALAVIIGIAVLTTVLSVIGPVKKINRMDIVNVVNAQ